MAEVSQTFKEYFNLNLYLPVVLVVHCAMVALGIWDRLLNLCTSSRFKFSTHDVDDEYTEKVSGYVTEQSPGAKRLVKQAISQITNRFSFDSLVELNPSYHPSCAQGRLLIRKEQEATLKGFQIGEVLHSAYFDLEFPTIAKARRKLL